MSKCCTVEWATAFATAHESEVPNNDDKRMDLNNNMVGRRLYASAPQSTPEAAQAALLDYKLLWINPDLKNVTVGVDYLVYLKPVQSMTVFDDGPEYDDVYTLAFAGKPVGDTPAGGSKAFEFDQLVSGEHAADIRCKLDGTKGGCGFQIRLTGALRLPSGEASTQQIVIEENDSHATRLAFPTMKTEKDHAAATLDHFRQLPDAPAAWRGNRPGRAGGAGLRLSGPDADAGRLLRRRQADATG